MIPICSIVTKKKQTIRARRGSHNIHGAQVAPGRISAKIFRDAGFEVNREPQEPQQKQRRSRRRLLLSQARPPAAWREEVADKSSTKQHSVRLIAGKILRSRDKREKADKTNRQHGSR